MPYLDIEVHVESFSRLGPPCQVSDYRRVAGFSLSASDRHCFAGMSLAHLPSELYVCSQNDMAIVSRNTAQIVVAPPEDVALNESVRVIPVALS
jgi:hypothetical protein